jgi:membrane protein
MTSVAPPGFERTWTFLREHFAEFFEEAPFEKAAAVSFYTLLALAPLLLVVVAIAGVVFGPEAVQGQVVSEIQGLVGKDGAEAVELVLQNATVPEKSAISVAIGVITLLVGASGVFVQLQSTLNNIWDVPTERRGPALWVFLRHRLVSMAMVVGLGFLLLVSLTVSALLSAVDARYSSLIPWPLAWQALNELGSMMVIALLIAMIFKFLPDTRIPWRDVWLGAFVTALLFTLGKTGIGAYLGRASIGSSYGAAGSVVVLVVWVYYASLIFFAGAEITQICARARRASVPGTRRASAGVPSPTRT